LLTNLGCARIIVISSEQDLVESRQVKGMKDKDEYIVKELDFFQIENSYGGNQDWLTDKMMYFGGCAAVTACESGIYYKKYQNRFKAIEGLTYPYSIQIISKENFIEFTKKMKPYLKPRIGGISKLSIYVKGFKKFLQEQKIDGLLVTEFSGNHTIDDAKAVIKNQIIQGHPIPYLLLHHKNSYFRHLTWHWFLILGFRESIEGFQVKITTYGKARWYLFEDLWNTGFQKKGGMILFQES
jgi:hypothetical protein